MPASKTVTALRAFAQSSRHSPEPARSVADLAELLALLIEEESAPAPAPEPVAADAVTTPAAA